MSMALESVKVYLIPQEPLFIIVSYIPTELDARRKSTSVLQVRYDKTSIKFLGL